MIRLKNVSLQGLLKRIDDPRQSLLLRIYDDHKDLFHQASGSSHNHQAWVGGYADHLAECLRANELVYAAMAQLRPLPFSMAGAAIALFFHDIEKPFRYGDSADPRCHRWQQRKQPWDELKWEILADLQQRYGFDLSDDELNGIRYTHGEGDDYRKDKRVSTPLAAHAHHCDNISARIWPEEGRNLS